MKKQEKKGAYRALGACLETPFIIYISISSYPSAFLNQYRLECYGKSMIISGKNWKSDLNTD